MEEKKLPDMGGGKPGNQNDTYAHKAASICVVAPIISLVIAHFTLNKGVDIPALNLAIIGLIAAFFITGVTAGVVALTGIGKFGARGILLKTAAGLGVTGIVLAIAIPSFFRYQQKAEAQRAENMEKMANEAFREHPGWVSVSNELGATIIAFSVHDDSEIGKEINKWFTMDVSTVKIVVYNPEENIPLDLDLREPSFLMEGEERIESLNPIEVLETAKSGNDSIIQQLGGKKLIKPGANWGAGVVFTPLGFDWSAVTGLNFKINNDDISLYGEYLTSEEKLERFPRE